jgi:hypothetical protein
MEIIKAAYKTYMCANSTSHFYTSSIALTTSRWHGSSQDRCMHPYSNMQVQDGPMCVLPTYVLPLANIEKHPLHGIMIDEASKLVISNFHVHQHSHTYCPSCPTSYYSAWVAGIQTMALRLRLTSYKQAIRIARRQHTDSTSDLHTRWRQVGCFWEIMYMHTYTLLLQAYTYIFIHLLIYRISGSWTLSWPTRLHPDYTPGLRFKDGIPNLQTLNHFWRH